MNWLYRFNYFGPDRRSNRFHVRFFERRGKRDKAPEADKGTRASLRTVLGDIAAKGLRWVDHIRYFGPDRRTGAYAFYFFERRKHSEVGQPPTLQAALRQLRVRVLEAEDADARAMLRERITATAVLADAKGRTDIGDLLIELAGRVEAAYDGDDLDAALQAKILRAEAMLAA